MSPPFSAQPPRRKSPRVRGGARRGRTSGGVFEAAACARAIPASMATPDVPVATMSASSATSWSPVAATAAASSRRAAPRATCASIFGMASVPRSRPAATACAPRGSAASSAAANSLSVPRLARARRHQPSERPAAPAHSTEGPDVSAAERMDREALLKKAAAVAGGVYFAPVLTAAAVAEAPGVTGCPRKCKTRKQRRQCRACCGFCSSDRRQCMHGDPLFCQHMGQQCDVLEPCGPPGANCACFFNAEGQNAGYCVDLRDGMCASFAPCVDGRCPCGQVCFSSCCPEPLCADVCTGSPAAAPRSAGGAGALYTSAPISEA